MYSANSAKYPITVQDEFLKKFLKLTILEKLEISPVKILENLINRFEFIEGVRATREIVYTKDNSPGFYKILSEAHSL